jgi:hypothetical protein
MEHFIFKIGFPSCPYYNNETEILSYPTLIFENRNSRGSTVSTAKRQHDCHARSQVSNLVQLDQCTPAWTHQPLRGTVLPLAQDHKLVTNHRSKSLPSSRIRTYDLRRQHMTLTGVLTRLQTPAAF